MDPPTPEDPDRIGPFRLVARLGAGGMGRVYLGRSDLGRTVAVKAVRAEYAADAEFRRRFAHEVAAARRVGGTWTAAVLDHDTEARVPWVATQYVAGPSLHDVVTRDFGPLPEESVHALAGGLARALGDIHAAGLVHRDLKPANVLVTVDGPRVIDFGIARALETLAEGPLTRTGAVVGSPGFMSPEQVRGQRLTPASDVFCLGSVLAFAATGRSPFGTADSGPHALLFRVAEEEPDLDGVPASLLTLVRDCLHKDPARRPAPEHVVARVGDALPRPWLPGELLADLGRRAARLLDFAPPPPRPDTAPPVPTPTPTLPSPASLSAQPAATPPPPAPASLSAHLAAQLAAAPTAPAAPPVPAPGRRPPFVGPVVRTAVSLLLATLALLLTDPSFEEALGIAWTDNVRPHAVVITVLGALVAVPWRPRGRPRPVVHLTVASAVAVACNVLMLIRHLQLPTG
ncbi:serine/threonine-protein kinase [Streptomyces hydrogenans]|uniref:serine/threonine-protein kinase n=1 Tax=Streptomyces hydrogenans TaxID=1873719 RepID=UPI0035E1603B